MGKGLKDFGQIHTTFNLFRDLFSVFIIHFYIVLLFIVIVIIIKYKYEGKLSLYIVEKS
jgi:hypothetical protein